MWQYEITTGRMLRPDGTLSGVGYAGGDLGEHPEGENNPADEGIPDIGPLPEGIYYMQTPVNTHGPFAIPLTPDASNNMHGRAGFMCHGDKIDAPGCGSEGCICIARAVRQEMWEGYGESQTVDHTLQVVKGEQQQ